MIPSTVSGIARLGLYSRGVTVALLLFAGSGACDVALFAPRICGGEQDVPCGVGRYCLLEVGACVLSGAAGVCSDMPEVCSALDAPVCGCDGKTYQSECEAAGVGINVAFVGDCADDSNRCGGTDGRGCDPGRFCKLDFGVCDAASQLGVCAPFPDGCSADFNPVCGCDGLSYINACAADSEGVNVASSDTCR